MDSRAENTHRKGEKEGVHVYMSHTAPGPD